jgi:hypothetical protein
MRRFPPALASHKAMSDRGLAWAPKKTWAVLMAVLFAAGLLSLMKPSEFLYFQF